jgi:hypothetical protein
VPDNGKATARLIIGGKLIRSIILMVAILTDLITLKLLIYADILSTFFSGKHLCASDVNLLAVPLERVTSAKLGSMDIEKT